MVKPAGISVVVPAYGRLDMLVAAINSIETSHPELVEIIIVDDASPVDPRPHLRKTNDCGIRIRCFRLSVNSGPQTARNLGIRRARFSHVSLLDSDDLFASDKIDRLLGVITADDPDIIFHAVDGLEKYNRLAGFWHRHLCPLLPFHWLIMLYNPVATPALTVRRRIALGPPGWRHCEDYAFLLNYTHAGDRVVYLPETLSSVRRNIGTSGGLSAALWSMRKGEFRARALLLKHRGWTCAGRFLLGSLAGCLRVLKDAVTCRYWKA